MLLGKKKKRARRDERKTVEDMLREDLSKVRGELLRLEEARRKGEISEERYLEMKSRLESMEREIENMLGGS